MKSPQFRSLFSHDILFANQIISTHHLTIEHNRLFSISSTLHFNGRREKKKIKQTYKHTHRKTLITITSKIAK